MQRERSKWRPHKDLSTDARHRDGPGRMSDEVPVMGMEQRPRIIRHSMLVNQRWEEPMEKAKPFAIPKRAVWNAYKKVRANKGAAGIDDMSIEAFDKDLKGNLYKLWNRLSSGSYFPPPVKAVPNTEEGRRRASPWGAHSRRSDSPNGGQGLLGTNTGTLLP